MKPELVLPFPTRYELVFHERIPRRRGLAVWQLPAAVHPDPQQELAAGPIVEVRPAFADPWVGIFFVEEPGNVRGTLIGWPDEESLCFFELGGAYLVHTARPDRVTTLGSGLLQQYYVVESVGMVLFVDGWTRVVAYGAHGELWKSRRLAEDDVRIVGVEDDTITCTGFFGGRSDIRFTVDLATGRPHEPGWER